MSYPDRQSLSVDAERIAAVEDVRTFFGNQEKEFPKGVDAVINIIRLMLPARGFRSFNLIKRQALIAAGRVAAQAAGITIPTKQDVSGAQSQKTLTTFSATLRATEAAGMTPVIPVYTRVVDRRDTQRYNRLHEFCPNAHYCQLNRHPISVQ